MCTEVDVLQGGLGSVAAIIRDRNLSVSNALIIVPDLVIDNLQQKISLTMTTNIC